MDGPHYPRRIFVDRSYAYEIIVEDDSCTAARVIGKLTGDTSLNVPHCDRFAVELFKWYPDVYLAPEANMYCQHPHQTASKKRTVKRSRRREQKSCKSRTAAPRLTSIAPCEAKTALELPKEDRKSRSMKKKRSSLDLRLVTRSKVREKKPPADWTIPSNISDRKLRPLLDFTANKMKSACKSFHDNMLQNFQGLKEAIRERRGILSFRKDRRALTDDEDNCAGYRQKVSKSSGNDASGKNIVTSASVPHITSPNLSLQAAKNLSGTDIAGSEESADISRLDYPENLDSKSISFYETDVPDFVEPDVAGTNSTKVNNRESCLQQRRKCNDFMSDVIEPYRPTMRVSSNVALLLLNLQSNRIRSRSMSTLNSYHLDRLFRARDHDDRRYQKFSTSGASYSKCEDDDNCGIKCKLEKFCQKKREERERRIRKAKGTCKKLFKTEDSSSCGAKTARGSCENKTKCKEKVETRKAPRKTVKSLSVQRRPESEQCKKTRKGDQGVPCTLPSTEKGCSKKRSSGKSKCGKVKCQSSCEKRSERSCGGSKCKKSNVDDVPKRFSSCGKGDDKDPCKKYRKDEHQGPPCKEYKKDDMSKSKNDPCKKYIHDEYQGPSCKRTSSKENNCDPCRNYRRDEHQGPPCKEYKKDENPLEGGDDPCTKYRRDEHQGPSCKKDNSKNKCNKKEESRCGKGKNDKRADSKCSDIKRVEPCKKKECPPVIRAPGCPDEGGKKGGGGGSSPCKNRKFSTLTAEDFAKELLIKTPWQLWNIRRSLSSNISSTDGYQMQSNSNLDNKSETRESVADTPSIDVFGILSMDDA